jgi:hypothetical protein
VREHVEVAVGDAIVRVFLGTEVIAEHTRSRAPHAVVADSAHFDGLWRARAIEHEVPKVVAEAEVETFGRSLDDYAAIVGGEVWR